MHSQATLSQCREDVPIYVCDTDEFAAITGFNLHRGCLALAERPTDRPRLDDIVRGADLLLVLEGVADADNVGSAFRNAAAFGARVVLSDTCCDPLYRKVDSHVDGQRAAALLTRACATGRHELAALKSEGFTSWR